MCDVDPAQRRAEVGRVVVRLVHGCSRLRERHRVQVGGDLGKLLAYERVSRVPAEVPPGVGERHDRTPGECRKPHACAAQVGTDAGDVLGIALEPGVAGVPLAGGKGPAEAVERSRGHELVGVRRVGLDVPTPRLGHHGRLLGGEVEGLGRVGPSEDREHRGVEAEASKNRIGSREAVRSPVVERDEHRSFREAPLPAHERDELLGSKRGVPRRAQSVHVSDERLRGDVAARTARLDAVVDEDGHTLRRASRTGCVVRAQPGGRKPDAGEQIRPDRRDQALPPVEGGKPRRQGEEHQRQHDHASMDFPPTASVPRHRVPQLPSRRVSIASGSCHTRMIVDKAANSSPKNQSRSFVFTK